MRRRNHCAVTDADSYVHQAIMCTDTNTTVFDDWKIEDYQHYYRELSSISPTGDIWANWMTHCSRWRSKAIEAYRGHYLACRRKTDRI